MDLHKRFKVLMALRDLSSKYGNSKNPHDVEQSKIIDAIEQDISNNDLQSAAVRFDALHYNVRKAIPFTILKLLDKDEYGV